MWITGYGWCSWLRQNRHLENQRKFLSYQYINHPPFFWIVRSAVYSGLHKGYGHVFTGAFEEHSKAALASRQDRNIIRLSRCLNTRQRCFRSGQIVIVVSA